MTSDPAFPWLAADVQAHLSAALQRFPSISELLSIQVRLQTPDAIRWPEARDIAYQVLGSSHPLTRSLDRWLRDDQPAMRLARQRADTDRSVPPPPPGGFGLMLHELQQAPPPPVRDKERHLLPNLPALDVRPAGVEPRPAPRSPAVVELPPAPQPAAPEPPHEVWVDLAPLAPLEPVADLADGPAVAEEPSPTPVDVAEPTPALEAVGFAPLVLAPIEDAVPVAVDVAEPTPALEAVGFAPLMIPPVEDAAPVALVEPPVPQTVELRAPEPVVVSAPAPAPAVERAAAPATAGAARLRSLQHRLNALRTPPAGA